MKNEELLKETEAKMLQLESQVFSTKNITEEH